jgi:hypothetical protein
MADPEETAKGNIMAEKMLATMPTNRACFIYLTPFNLKFCPHNLKIG